MSNPYFDFSTPFEAGTLVRADEVNSWFDSIQTAFDQVEGQLQLRLEFSPDFAGSKVLPSQSYARQLLYVNASGNMTFYSFGLFEDRVEDALAAATAAGLSETAAQTAQGLSESAQAASEAARDASQTAQGLSEAARDRSQEWAENAYQIEVVPGSYSALSWAEQSRQWAETAYNVEVVTGSFSALHWSEQAYRWSQTAHGTEVLPGEYSANHWAEQSRLWAESDAEVEAGQYSARHWAEACSAIIEHATGDNLLPWAAVTATPAAGAVLVGNAPGVLPSWLQVGDPYEVLSVSPSGSVIWQLPAASIALEGDLSGLYETQSRVLTINSYDSFRTYTGTATAGTISISGNSITYTAPSVSVETEVQITLFEDGRPYPVPPFTVYPFYVLNPVVSVTGSPSNVPPEPTISTTAFQTNVAGGDDHDSTNWEVRLAANNSLVWSKTGTGSERTSVVVPKGVVQQATQYVFLAKHNSVSSGSSNWVSHTAYTEAMFDPVPLLAVSHNSTSGTNINITVYSKQGESFDHVSSVSSGTYITTATNVTAFSYNDDALHLWIADPRNAWAFSRNKAIFTSNPILIFSEIDRLPDIDRFSRTGWFVRQRNTSFSTYSVKAYNTSQKRYLNFFTGDFDSLQNNWPGYWTQFTAVRENGNLIVMLSNGTHRAMFQIDSVGTPTQIGSVPTHADLFDYMNDTAAGFSSTALVVYRVSGVSAYSIAQTSVSARSWLKLSRSADYVAVSGAGGLVTDVFLFSSTLTKCTFSHPPPPLTSGILVDFSPDSSYFAIGNPSVDEVWVYKRTSSTSWDRVDILQAPSAIKSVSFGYTGW